MKVAVVQLNAGECKERNIERAQALVTQAVSRRAEFILLPETFNFRGAPDARKGYRGDAEDIPGESTRPFMDLARRERVTVLLGSLCERIRKSRKVYNTSVLINPKGEIQAVYRKIHLFDANIGKKSLRESKNFMGGKKLSHGRVKNFTAGLTICYDLRFPDIYRTYARLGAHILCVPSSFTRLTGKAHWEVLLRARAIENRCYVLAPNQVGRDGHGVFSYGHSMIIDPWGKVLARASGNSEEVIFAHLTKTGIESARRALPAVL